MTDYMINRPFVLMISLDLMKSSEIRKASDRSNSAHTCILLQHFLKFICSAGYVVKFSLSLLVLARNSQKFNDFQIQIHFIHSTKYFVFIETGYTYLSTH